MLLRHWLKLSLHTARRVHESSIGMKIGAGLPTARLFIGAACRVAFPLRSSAASCHRHARRASPAIPGFASTRRNYGNIARLAKDLQKTINCTNSRCFARIDIVKRVEIYKTNFPSKLLYIHRHLAILELHERDS